MSYFFDGWASRIMNLSFLKRKSESCHDRVHRSLPGYLDGRLPHSLAEEMESHLAVCQRCSADLQALRATRQLVQGLPSPRLPRSFLLQAAPEASPPPRTYFYLRTATATVAVAFVALIAASATLPLASAPNSAAGVQAGTAASQRVPSAQVAAPRQAAAQPAPSAALAPAPSPPVASQRSPEPPAAAAAPPSMPDVDGAPKLTAPLWNSSPPAPSTGPSTVPENLPFAFEESAERDVPPLAPEQNGGVGDLVAVLRTATGLLTLFLAIATSALWWRSRGYRR